MASVLVNSTAIKLNLQLETAVLHNLDFDRLGIFEFYSESA